MTRDVYRRFRMEMRLPARPHVPEPPAGFSFADWDAESPAIHAAILHDAFLGQPDGLLFEAFASESASLELLCILSSHARFLPSASPHVLHGGRPVACIQVLSDGPSGAAVQNLAVLPGYRRIGLATRMMAEVLARLYDMDRRTVRLEVTAVNKPAMELYQRLGFDRKKTTYQDAPAVTPAAYATRSVSMY